MRREALEPNAPLIRTSTLVWDRADGPRLKQLLLSAQAAGVRRGAAVLWRQYVLIALDLEVLPDAEEAPDD